jgi:hypothetical protein
MALIDTHELRILIMGARKTFDLPAYLPSLHIPSMQSTLPTFPPSLQAAFGVDMAASARAGRCPDPVPTQLVLEVLGGPCPAEVAGRAFSLQVYFYSRGTAARPRGGRIWGPHRDLGPADCPASYTDCRRSTARHASPPPRRPACPMPRHPACVATRHAATPPGMPPRRPSAPPPGMPPRHPACCPIPQVRR